VRVRVIRVGAIPFGLSALVDQQPGSLVVWLLESDWSEATARLMEQVLATQWPARGGFAIGLQSDSRTV
jgi:hypothetical protein